MKILHVSAQKPNSTGSGVYLYETASGFAELGAEQVVIAGIAPEDDPDMPEGVLFRPVVFEREGLPFPVVGMSNEMPYRATRYRDLTSEMVAQIRTAFDEVLDEVLHDFAPDLVICHHLYLVTSHFAMRDWPCPIVGISHSTDLRQFNTIPLERKAIAAGVNRLTRVFALQRAQAHEIHTVFGVDEEKIDVVGTGYNDREFRLLEGVDRVSHSLVYVGKIWKQKGVPNLLKALDLLSKEYGDVHLDLVGGHSNHDEYDDIISQSKTCMSSFCFRGKISQDDLVRAYNRAEVFVLPSLSEGLPLVIIEALACGCKVVVTDLPGIREWIDSVMANGPVIYVTPPKMSDDGSIPPALARRFEEDLAQALAQAFALPGQPADVKNLSWKGVCKRMLEKLGM